MFCDNKKLIEKKSIYIKDEIETLEILETQSKKEKKKHQNIMD